jgi:anti-sigma regulatory factor (Ser/Thr protein kinase)
VDEGSGFDLANFKHDPTSAENIGREDGRGLFLMRKLMDRVERLQENGNVIRMTVNR